MSSKPKDSNPRRKVLQGMAGVGTAALLSACSPSAPTAPPAAKREPVRFDDPEWNRDALARMSGNMDFGKVKHGWYGGSVLGVREGEALRPLMDFEGFSSIRLVDNGDGSYQRLLRETVYYKDLATGEVMDTYVNPYTDEEVRVVPVTNDPFNQVISQYAPKGPSYGGLREVKQERKPLQLAWKITKPDTVTLSRDIHLYYPSALQPAEWPRESSGKMVRVSEFFRHVVSKDDLENPELTAIEYNGTWARVTPWLPWMLMGQAEGHIMYMGRMGSFNNLDMLSPQVRAYAEKNHPQYFDAPEEWVEPSLSSLEDYARTQTPAPVKM